MPKPKRGVIEISWREFEEYLRNQEFDYHSILNGYTTVVVDPYWGNDPNTIDAVKVVDRTHEQPTRLLPGKRDSSSTGES